MASLPAPGALIGGRYRVERMIGEGGMGAVFAALDTSTGRAVAIKWLLPDAARSEEMLQRFAVEAQAMARIEHPNVVSVLDVGRDGAAPFLVMERLRGESLQARLTRVGRLSVVEALDVIIAASAGVAEAHAERIVHRDLKPANIFLCEGKDGSPHPAKVLDFGVSKLTSVESTGRPLTKTGVAVGTPSYMAPEQLSGDTNADPRCDIYSLGVVLYQMLIGRRPFVAQGLLQLVAKINAGQPTPPRAIAPEIPVALEDLTLRAMSARPSHRPVSAAALLRELGTIREALGPGGARIASVRPPAFPPPGPDPVITRVAGSDPSSGGAGPSTRSAPAWGPSPHAVSSPSFGSAPGLPSPTPATTAMPHLAPAHSARPTPSVPAPARARVSWPLVAFAGLLGGAVVAGSVALLIMAIQRDQLPSRTDAPSTETPPLVGEEEAAPSSDPLAPDLDLTFTGCAPEFDGSPAVTAYQGGLTISGHRQGDHRGGIVFQPGHENLTGSIQLSTHHMQETEMQILVMEGQRYFANYATDQGADRVTGTLSFRAYDARRGILDVTFDDVTLQAADGIVCRLQGRLRTRGLTWGNPDP